MPERVVREGLDKEAKYRDLDMLKFYEYSASWWTEYQGLGYG